MVHSPKYSNRRVTKKTAQLHPIGGPPVSSNPVDSSARVKLPHIRFS